MAAMLTCMTRLLWYWMRMVRNNKPLAILFLIDVGDEVLSILHISIFERALHGLDTHLPGELSIGLYLSL
jgi:hypothetical protein